MAPAASTDTKTHLANIREATDSIQSGWLARPPLGHPHRSLWENRCREEVKKLKDILRMVSEANEPLAVPPLVLAFLAEHTRAYAARQSEYNYEALNPENTIQSFGKNFTRDDKYRVRVKRSGWWTDLAVLDDASSEQQSRVTSSAPRVIREESSAAHTGEATTRANKAPPRKRDASAPSPTDEPAVEAARQESSRTTRARSRAGTKPHTPQAAASPAPDAPRQPPPNPTATKTKKSPATELTPTGSRDVSGTPAPRTNDEALWDPASKEIVDEWLVSPIQCKRCSAAGYTCRVNLVHGVACNRCTGSSVGCSFAAKQPGRGVNWSYDQRRWIFVHWARHAKAKTPYPSEVAAPFDSQFEPPEWFIDALQAARKDAEPVKKRGKRARADSPIGPKRRPAAIPVTDSDDEAASVKTGTPVKRKRRTRSKTAPLKDNQDTSDADRDSEESEADTEAGAADIRPIKRPRTDSRASSTLPQPLRSWKDLRNVEHMLREGSASTEATTALRHAADPFSSADAQYAPEFDQDLLEPPTVAEPPPMPRTQPVSVPHPSSFAVIGSTRTGPQLVRDINAINHGFNARLAEVWQALGRQQVAHELFKEQALRELQEVKSALAATRLDHQMVSEQRDSLSHESLSKEAEIQQLRSQVLALQARLYRAPSPNPTMAPANNRSSGGLFSLFSEPAADHAVLLGARTSSTDRPRVHSPEAPQPAAADNLPAGSAVTVSQDGTVALVEHTMSAPEVAVDDIRGDRCGKAADARPGNLEKSKVDGAVPLQPPEDPTDHSPEAPSDHPPEAPRDDPPESPSDDSPEGASDQPHEGPREPLPAYTREEVARDHKQLPGAPSRSDDVSFPGTPEASHRDSPSLNPTKDLASPRQASVPPSPLHPSVASTGMKALSQYSSSDGSTGSCSSSRAGSPGAPVENPQETGAATEETSEHAEGEEGLLVGD